MNTARDIRDTYVHFREGGAADAIPVSASFWTELAAGAHAQLEQGRLMTAFTFSESWPTWERHPAGEELVLLLTPGAGTEHRPVAR